MNFDQIFLFLLKGTKVFLFIHRYSQKTAGNFTLEQYFILNDATKRYFQFLVPFSNLKYK